MPQNKFKMSIAIFNSDLKLIFEIVKGLFPYNLHTAKARLPSPGNLFIINLLTIV